MWQYASWLFQVVRISLEPPARGGCFDLIASMVGISPAIPPGADRQFGGAFFFFTFIGTDEAVQGPMFFFHSQHFSILYRPSCERPDSRRMGECFLDNSRYLCAWRSHLWTLSLRYVLKSNVRRSFSKHKGKTAMQWCDFE